MRDRTAQINPTEEASPSYVAYLKARNEMDAGNLDAAILLFRESMADAAHAKTAELLAECLFRTGRFDDAVKTAELATQLGLAARAASPGAQWRYETGDIAAAKSYLAEALRRNSTYGPALKLLGQINEAAAK
jgi:tetratricopeptide (TPR) repeat protein